MLPIQPYSPALSQALEIQLPLRIDQLSPRTSPLLNPSNPSSPPVFALAGPKPSLQFFRPEKHASRSPGRIGALVYRRVNNLVLINEFALIYIYARLRRPPFQSLNPSHNLRCTSGIHRPMAYSLLPLNTSDRSDPMQQIGMLKRAAPDTRVRVMAAMVSRYTISRTACPRLVMCLQTQTKATATRPRGTPTNFRKSPNLTPQVKRGVLPTQPNTPFVGIADSWSHRQATPWVVGYPNPSRKP